MHWSWHDLEETPKDVIDELIAMLNDEEEERRIKEEQEAFFKSKGL